LTSAFASRSSLTISTFLPATAPCSGVKPWAFLCEASVGSASSTFFTFAASLRLIASKSSSADPRAAAGFESTRTTASGASVFIGGPSRGWG
jgi:hypothetical protein